MGQDSISKKVLWAFCPLIFGESFEDFAEIALLFPDFSLKNVIVLICVFVFYLVFIFDGLFFFLVDTHFLLMARSSLGPFLSPIHVVVGITLSEMVILRSYCIYSKVKFGKRSITWFNIVSKMGKSEHPKLILVSRFLFLQLWLGSSVIYLTNHLTKLLLERSTPADYVANVAWFVIEVTLLRLTIVELPLYLLMAYGCYVQVNIRMDRLLAAFRQLHLTMDAVTKYLRLVKLIIDVDPFMKLLSLINNISVIIFVSLIIIIAITPAENDVQLIIKSIYLLTGILYATRGILMTSVVSRIDSNSRVLYKLIATRIARGATIGSISHSQLMLIMDDLASNKNHICMREYSGSPSDQMDILINVVNIAQFVMLLREFSVQLGF